MDFGSSGGSSRLWEIKNYIYLILKRRILGATGADLHAGGQLRPAAWRLHLLHLLLSGSSFPQTLSKSRFQMYRWFASACSFWRSVSAGRPLTFWSGSGHRGSWSRRNPSRIIRAREIKAGKGAIESVGVNLLFDNA